MSIDKDSPSIESAAWLNALIQHAWRVKSGGFEPMLSSYLSSMLAESLSQPYSKSSGVAHVALDAFTLGSSPPMISRIELNGLGKEDDSIILMNIDVGMLLRDAVLLLGECMGLHIFPGITLFICQRHH
jgi:Ca2+-dependent lipid-binding protein